MGHRLPTASIVLLVAAASLVAGGAEPPPEGPYPRPGRTIEVSVAPDGSPGTGAPTICSSSLSCSGYADVSADGNIVAFSTAHTNIVDGDTNDAIDVFVRDVTTGVTERVSVATDGTQADAISAEPTISADGRFVAFTSQATNLDPRDTSDNDDVYVHDRASGETRLVSISPDGEHGTKRSVGARISGDGNFVAFWSDAFGDDTTNDPTLPGGGFNFGNVYLHDLRTGTTELVSLAADGRQSTSVTTYQGFLAIDHTGRHVAWETRRHDHVDGDVNGNTDIFVRDRVTGETQRISVDSDGEGANWASYAPAISADGRFVSFYSFANNLVPGDRNHSTTGVLGGGASADVFVHDRQTGTTDRVSVTSAGAEVPYGSTWTDISADGRYVAFVSDATALDGPPGYGSRAYVHDRLTGQTELVSKDDLDEARSADFTALPALSADGRHVVFVDTNDSVYRRDRGGPLHIDASAAGMPDGTTTLTGWVTASGVTIASAIDPRGDAVGLPAGAGTDILAASLIARPEVGDVAVRVRLDRLPTTASALPGTNYVTPSSPGVYGTVTVIAFRSSGRDYEARIVPPAVGGARLYDCTAACTDAGALDGGYGTVGHEIRLSLPAGLLGAGLDDVTIATGLGDVSNGLVATSDTLSVGGAQQPRLTLEVRDGGSEPAPVALVAGRFDRTLESSPGTSVELRLCLAAACTVSVVAVS